ncbi:MAG: GNAT family N-acetyltransferase [Oscillospiraceae bacterium]|nr:GNAT family N-acetyltransferase [Oscillospiraceae bacterium]
MNNANDFVIRPWTAADKEPLKALWQIAFGDDEDYISNFHDLFLTADGCIVAQAENRVVSAMYILDGAKLFTGRKTMPSAAYTYALATLPEYRNRGIGSAVYRACVQAAYERADAACVLPAEAGLYPFYENASGAKPLSYIREIRMTREELMSHRDGAGARISSLEYSGLREVLLGGMPHASLPIEFLDMEEYQARDGGLFMSGSGIAAAEMEGTVCRMVEVLDPDGDGLAAAAAAAAYCPAEEYILRTPLFFDGPGEERPFMLASFQSAPPRSLPDDFWWGPAFD